MQLFVRFAIRRNGVLFSFPANIPGFFIHAGRRWKKSALLFSQALSQTNDESILLKYFTLLPSIHVILRLSLLSTECWPFLN